MNIWLIIAFLSNFFAKVGAGSASSFNYYQPALPKELETEE